MLTVILMILSILMPLIERLFFAVRSRRDSSQPLSDREKGRLKDFVLRCREIETDARAMGCDFNHS